MKIHCGILIERLNSIDTIKKLKYINTQLEKWQKTPKLVPVMHPRLILRDILGEIQGFGHCQWSADRPVIN